MRRERNVTHRLIALLFLAASVVTGALGPPSGQPELLASEFGIAKHGNGNFETSQVELAQHLGDHERPEADLSKPALCSALTGHMSNALPIPCNRMPRRVFRHRSAGHVVKPRMKEVEQHYDVCGEDCSLLELVKPSSVSHHVKGQCLDLMTFEQFSDFGSCQTGRSDRHLLNVWRRRQHDQGAGYVEDSTLS